MSNEKKDRKPRKLYFQDWTVKIYKGKDDEEGQTIKVGVRYNTYRAYDQSILPVSGGQPRYLLPSERSATGCANTDLSDLYDKRGGGVIVQVHLDGRFGIGVSYCSMSDKFKMRKGIRLALTRILRHMTHDGSTAPVSIVGPEGCLDSEVANMVRMLLEKPSTEVIIDGEDSMIVNVGA